MADKKKNLLDKAVDALTDRDEKEAVVKAQGAGRCGAEGSGGAAHENGRG